MQEAAKTRVVRASALVLATGVNVLFVALLVSSRARDTPEPEPLVAAMMWIVLEQSRVPQPRPARDRRRVPPEGVERALVVVPTAPDASLQSMPTQPAPQDPQTPPAVDWALQSQLVAERAAANYGKADSFSPLPATGLAAKLCAPRVPGATLQAQMDELLPPPPEPAPPPQWPPAGSVRLAGNVIVQFIETGERGNCALTIGYSCADQANWHLLDDMKDPARAPSSVPDPNKCD